MTRAAVFHLHKTMTRYPLTSKGYFGYMMCLEELCAEAIATGKLMS